MTANKFYFIEKLYCEMQTDLQPTKEKIKKILQKYNVNLRVLVFVCEKKKKTSESCFITEIFCELHCFLFYFVLRDYYYLSFYFQSFIYTLTSFSFDFISEILSFIWFDFLINCLFARLSEKKNFNDFSLSHPRHSRRIFIAIRQIFIAIRIV